MALIRLFSATPEFDFLSRRRLFFGFSLALVLASIGLFLFQGLNFGVDFRGGTLLEVRVKEGTTISDLRSRVSGLPLGEITLQEFGNPQDILINIARQQGDEAEQMAAIAQVRAAVDDRVEDYRRQEFVGPKVGAELKRAGLLATVLALTGIGLYIWFRFEWQFSLAAMVALSHDVIVTIGFFALTQIEFNLATLAAVLIFLTLVGFFLWQVGRSLERYRASLLRQENFAAMGRMTAGIAHEIRNPLGIIKGAGEHLQRKLTAAGVEDEVAGYISDEVDRLDRILILYVYVRPAVLMPTGAALKSH